MDCIMLETVYGGREITEIGESAFCYCSNLKNFSISDKISIIKSSTFDGCEDLEDIVIPSSVIAIKEEAFMFCESLKNVLVNDLYNDLGFRVGSRLIILVEAQSSWSPNILIRALLYVATTYQKYIDERNLDVYSSKKVDIPKPELYVIYTGDRKTRPKELQLSKEFFPDATAIVQKYWNEVPVTISIQMPKEN